MKYLLSVLFLISNVFASNGILKTEKGLVWADRVIIKTESLVSAKGISSDNLIAKLEKLGVYSIEKTLENSKFLKKGKGELETIYTLYFSAPYTPEFISRKIMKLEGIDWAEPKYLDELIYTPNDYNSSQQYFLDKINAQAAWDVTKGDSDIKVAIIDTGVDWNHPDLEANIWINQAELNGTEGVDDDQNGYIDDIRGWDFGGLMGIPDNDPTEDRPDHGTHVAGLSSAVTDNNTGIASIGFNTSIMPIKTSQDNIRNDNGQALIAYGYEGIIYAVDNGADVINLSWGGENYSSFAQTVIDYAVNNGVVVVAAAGNNNSQNSFYPAYYNGVLSVGATNSTDGKASFSNYGKFLDVMAPGSGIVSTWQNDVYASLQGTSMASPIAAGLVALVIDRFPNYTPLQIIEQVRVTADDIYSVNQSYNYLLGKGRINAQKAVSTTNSISVRLTDFNVIDLGDGDGILEPGEDFEIQTNFMNYLNSVAGLTINLISTNNNISFSNGSFSIGSVASLTGFNNSSSKFRGSISQNIGENTEANFRLEYSAGSYNDFQWISVLVNPTYRTLEGNAISMTVTSKGTLGFNDYPDNINGDGFKYNEGSNLIFEGGLMYGYSPTFINNAIRNSDGSSQDNDFKVLAPFIVDVPGITADEQGFAEFNDSQASNSLGIRTELFSFGFSGEDSNYIVLKYVFHNESISSDISNFYAGLYFDWDIDGNTYDDNIVDYDDINSFGYTYSQSGSGSPVYIAASSISDGNQGFYAIANDGSDGGMNVYDGFSDTEKFSTLSSGLSKTSTGPADISFVISAGPITIPKGGEKVVGFILAAGEGKSVVEDAIAKARIKYPTLLTNSEDDLYLPIEYKLSQNYPNPFNPSTTISYSIAEQGLVKLSIFDILGRNVAELVNDVQKTGNYNVEFNGLNLSSGVYFYKLETGSFVSVKKMMLLK